MEMSPTSSLSLRPTLCPLFQNFVRPIVVDQLSGPIAMGLFFHFCITEVGYLIAGRFWPIRRSLLHRGRMFVTAVLMKRDSSRPPTTAADRPADRFPVLFLAVQILTQVHLVSQLCRAC